MKPQDPTPLQPTPTPATESKPRWRWPQRNTLRLPQLSQVGWKTLALTAVTLVVLSLLLREALDDAYYVETFEVPEVLVQQGYNGRVVALKLLDAVQDMQRQAQPLKPGQKMAEVGGQDVKLEVMGVGINPRSVSRYLGELLGIQSRRMGGEFTLQSGQLVLNLRISGVPPVKLQATILKEQWAPALDSVLQAAAEKVMLWADPLTLARFLNNGSNTQLRKMALSHAKKYFPGDSLWIAYESLTSMSKVYSEAFVKRNPDFYAAYHSLGMRYANDTTLSITQRVIQSTPFHEQALQLNPDFPNAACRLLRNYHHLGNFKKRDSIRAVMETRFTAYPIVHRFLIRYFCDYYFDAAKLRAQLAATQAMQMELGGINNADLSFGYWHLGEYDLALAYAQAAKQSDYEKALAYTAKKEFAKAAPLIQQLSPGYKEYLEELTYGFAGDTSNFIRLADKYLQMYGPLRLGVAMESFNNRFYYQVKPYSLYTQNKQYLALLCKHGIRDDSSATAGRKP